MRPHVQRRRGGAPFRRLVPRERGAQQAAADTGEEDRDASGKLACSCPGNRPGDDCDAELRARAHERHEEREKGEREDEVDADLLRVGDRGAEQRPRERGQVPHDEQAQLGAEQEPEGALVPGDDDSERLVGEEVGPDGRRQPPSRRVRPSDSP